MKIVLIGYMGSGKSAVGKQLALALGFDFKDLDLEIETCEKKSISQIFSSKGEIYFRKTERIVLKAVLETETDFVLATGGGTPCYGDTMDLLLRDRDVISIYLKSSIDMLTNRIFPEKFQRPLISHITSKEVLRDYISKHLFERSHYYNRASLIIDIDSLSVLEIVEEIRSRLA